MEGDWGRRLGGGGICVRPQRIHVIPLSGVGRGSGDRKPPGRFSAWRVFQIGLSREAEEPWKTGLGREIWAILLRDLNSKQGFWNLIAKVPLKEPGRGMTSPSGVFRRLM